MMGQKRKSKFSDSRPLKKTKFLASSPGIAAGSQQESDSADKHLIALDSQVEKGQIVVKQDLLHHKKHDKLHNESDLKFADKLASKKSKRSKKSQMSQGNVKLKKKNSSDKNSCSKDKQSLLETRSDKTSFESASQKLSLNYPIKKSEASCNWKKLIESGKIKYTGKKTASNNAKINREQKGDEKKESNAKTNEIWFDGVDELLLENGIEDGPSSNGKMKNNPLVKPNAFEGMTKVMAIDCEMVGAGPDGQDNLLARVSIVNHFGQCLYDKYVKPTEKVKDYRTFVSGIRPSDIENGEEFKVVQKEVSDMLNGRILVGHAIHNDLKVLFLDHPKKKIRDTSRYKIFRSLFNGATPSLKKLCEKLLSIRIQDGEHNSVQDAQAAMRLYTMHRKNWERSIKKTKNKKLS